MKKPFGQHKTKAIRITVLGIIIIIFSIVIAVNLIAPNLIKHRLNQTSAGPFSVSVDKAKVKLFKKHISLNTIILNDTTEGNNISISKITVDGIRYLPLLFREDIILDSLLIFNPKVNFYVEKKTGTSRQPKINKSKNRKISLKKIGIRDADAKIKKKDGLIKVSGVNFSLHNFARDTTAKYTFKGFSFDQYLVSIDSFSIPFSENLYTFQFSDMNYNPEAQTYKIQQAKIVTRKEKYEAGRKKDVETDWFDFVFEDIKFEDFNLNSLLNDSSVVIRHISIDKFNGKSFRDKRLPFPKKPDTKLPMAMIDSFSFGLHIDSVAIKNANIKYEERVKNTDKAGEVFFTNLNAKLFQVSNIKKLIHSPTKIIASANFMDQPLIEANFDMPNKKYPIPYRVEGTIAPSRLKIFNRMLEENLSAKIKEGNMNQLVFDFQYNNDFSKGALFMEYSDLKIDFLKQKDDSKNQLKSLFFNSIILRNKNLNEKKNYRTGEIYFERDKKKSIFNYWWKSLSSGIKSIVVR